MSLQSFGTPDLSGSIPLPGGLSFHLGGPGFSAENIAGVAGGILGTIGAEQAAAGQSAADLAQAQAYNFNAASSGVTAGNIWSATARLNAADAYQANRLIGKQRSQYGAAGVNPNSGTPLDLLADTEAEIKTEAMNRFYTGKEQAGVAGAQYTADQMSAAAATDAASRARSAGNLGALGGALN